MTDKKTGQLLACKSISKRKLVTPEDIQDVQREVQIMHHLAGHGHVVKMFGAYEDKHHVHIVMEVCQGGELFDRIVERGKYTEKDAAAAIRTIVQVRTTTTAMMTAINIIHSCQHTCGVSTTAPRDKHLTHWPPTHAEGLFTHVDCFGHLWLDKYSQTS